MKNEQELNYLQDLKRYRKVCDNRRINRHKTFEGLAEAKYELVL